MRTIFGPDIKYQEENVRTTPRSKKKAAIKAYIVNGKNAAKTVRELGYPSIPGLIKWYDRYRPVAKEKPNQYTSAQVSEKYHVSRATLYEWKEKYIREGKTVLKAKRLKTTDGYEREIEQLSYGRTLF